MSLQYAKLFKISNGDKDTVIQILSKSVNSGWADFYPLKEDKKKQPNKLEQKEGTKDFESWMK